MFIYSDGFCECFDTGDGKVTEKIVKWLEAKRMLEKETLDLAIKEKMKDYYENNPEADDISLVVMTVN